MLEVRYMTDVRGKRFVVSHPDATIGYEFNGVIYDTAFEASKAEGELNQLAYFNERFEAAKVALDGILWSVCPPSTYYYDDQEEQRARNAEIACGIMDALFPSYRGRDEKNDHYAISFLDEIAKAEAVYREM